jgi:hypothetical protein
VEANLRHQSGAEWIGITEIKIEKGAILLQASRQCVLSRAGMKVALVHDDIEK